MKEASSGYSLSGTLYTGTLILLHAHIGRGCTTVVHEHNEHIMDIMDTTEAK